MLTYFIIKYKNIMSVSKTIDLIRKGFKYWEAVKLMVIDTIFPKFQYSLDTLNWQNIYFQFFSLKWQAYFFIFKKLSTKYLNLYSLLIFISSDYSVQWKKVASSACNLTNCTQAFMLDNHHTSEWSRSVLCVLSILLFKNDIDQRSTFNKIVHLQDDQSIWTLRKLIDAIKLNIFV